MPIFMSFSWIMRNFWGFKNEDLQYSMVSASKLEPFRVNREGGPGEAGAEVIRAHKADHRRWSYYCRNRHLRETKIFVDDRIICNSYVLSTSLIKLNRNLLSKSMPASVKVSIYSFLNDIAPWCCSWFAT